MRFDFLYILAIVPGLMPWESGYRFLSFCHVFGSVAPWCGSFVYHLFMNIERGESVYYTLLKLDMVGIWVTQSFGLHFKVINNVDAVAPFYLENRNTEVNAEPITWLFEKFQLNH
uniref:Uncharacterized protein n=1 Tax=Glossina austeni TaxID=7395 RepID=A0A1A9UQ83_GLOAU